MKDHFNPQIIMLPFQSSKWLKYLLNICKYVEKWILTYSLGINSKAGDAVPADNLKSTYFQTVIFISLGTGVMMSHRKKYSGIRGLIYRKHII